MAGVSHKYNEAHVAFVQARPTAKPGALYDEFVDTFGYKPAFNAFRQFVARIRKGGGYVGRKPEAITTKVATFQPVTDATIEKLSREEQDRITRQHDKEVMSKLVRERAHADRIITAIRDTAASVRGINVAPVVPVINDHDSREQTAVLLFSDLHVGANVDDEESGGFGTYNYPIFRERLARLSYGVRSITAHHRKSHDVKKLVVLSLGDLIENVTIFPSQRDQADDLTEQVLNARVDIAEFYLGLLDTFESIDVVAVSGNHGRIGRKGEFKHHVNWDYIISKSLEDQFSRITDRVTFNVPKSPFAVVDIEGWTFLMRHGDGIKSWGGIPFYGIARSTGRWVAMQASVGKRFDYMAMGHFHQRADLPFTGGEVLMNGSFVGTSQFTVEVMESASRPEQIFGMVHPRHGLGGRYPIHLDGGGKLVNKTLDTPR